MANSACPPIEDLRRARGFKTGNQQAIAPEFLKGDWIHAAAQGKREQGRKLFEAAGCVKCHAISADAAKRFTVPYLVESVLLPIEQRTLQNLSPMPQGLVRRPDELRDSLSFLLSAAPK